MEIVQNGSFTIDPYPCVNPTDQFSNDSSAISNGDTLFFVLYSTFITFGITGNSLCIVAMYEQLRRERIYYFQLLIMLSDLMACVFLIPKIIYQPLIIRATAGPNWAKQNFYFCWYMIAMGTAFSNWTITCSITLIAFTSLDRLQALLSPQNYIQSNQRKRAFIAALISIIVGFLTCLHDCWRREMVYCSVTSSFEVITKPATTLQTVMEFVRLFVRVVALLLMTVSMAIMSLKYLRFRKRHENVLNKKHKFQTEKAVSSTMLIQLSAVQTCAMIGGFTPLIVWHLHLYILTPLGYGFNDDQAISCLKFSEISLLFPLCFTFLFHLLVSKRFRKTVRRLFASRKSSFSLVPQEQQPIESEEQI